MRRLTILGLASTLLAGGCAPLGPAYQRPAVLPPRAGG